MKCETFMHLVVCFSNIHMNSKHQCLSMRCITNMSSPMSGGSSNNYSKYSLCGQNTNTMICECPIGKGY